MIGAESSGHQDYGCGRGSEDIDISRDPMYARLHSRTDEVPKRGSSWARLDVALRRSPTGEL